jgi:hypothetical protein
VLAAAVFDVDVIAALDGDVDGWRENRVLKNLIPSHIIDFY